MSLSLKKALRSAQVLAPGLQEARFAVHRKALRLLGRTWRPDIGAMRHFIVDEPFILDVGANRGFSISDFLMLRARAEIVAFEPLAQLAAILRSRYQDAKNVTIHSCALGTINSQMTIYTPVYRGYRFDPLSSLDHEEAANWVNSDRFYFFDPGKLKIEEETVAVCRLDDFATKPDVIKIYAQGYEPEVIQGGERTVRQCEPAIMVPARIPRIDGCLRDLGYTRYAFHSGRFHFEAEGHTSSWYLKRKHLDMFRC
jgi:FkbM family methyltransferase